MHERDAAECLWRLARAPSNNAAHAAHSAKEAHFGHDGFCLLPGLVGEPKISAALRYLNHHLGSADLAKDIEPQGLGMEFAQGTEQGVVKLGGGHRCTCSLAQAAPLLELLGADERGAIRRALGEQEGCAERRGPVSPMFGCQVALRFPLALAAGVLSTEEALPPLLERLEWHTDAAKYNAKKRFDVVVGVFLSDVQRASDGALWVAPGSQVAERDARESGALDPRDVRCGAGVPSSRPIVVPAGTAIVFDKDLLHAGGPNLGAGIRYALYYRLRLEGS